MSVILGTFVKSLLRILIGRKTIAPKDTSNTNENIIDHWATDKKGYIELLR